MEKTGPDWDYSASPSLATMPDGRTVIIASPKQAVVRALDPDKNGATIWEQDIARGIGGGAGETVFGGAVDNRPSISDCISATDWWRWTSRPASRDGSVP